jgi:hypothetical protein
MAKYSDYSKLAEDALTNLKSFEDRLAHGIRTYQKTIREQAREADYLDDVVDYESFKQVVKDMFRLQNGVLVDFKKIVSDYAQENERLGERAKNLGLDEKAFQEMMINFLTQALSRR